MLRLDCFELKSLLFLVLFFCLPFDLYASDPASSWVENSPGALNCDMLGLATHDGLGTVMVGRNGKSYYMTAAVTKSNNPSWTECVSPTQKDFVAVDRGDSCFMALTENEWYVSSISGSTLSWVKKGECSVAQDVCGPLVGVCHADGDVFVAVTSKGYLFRFKDTSESNVGNNRLGDMCAAGKVKGIKNLRQYHDHNEKMFYCYGYPGADGINILRIRFDGTDLNSSPDLQSTIAIKETGQPIEINDLCLITHDGVAVAGQNGVYGLVRDNMFYADSSPRDFTSASFLSVPVTNSFKSVYLHNPGSGYMDYYGYAVCEGGRVFCTSRIFDMGQGVYVESVTEVAANIYSDNFNSVAYYLPCTSTSGRHFFAAGSNGLSIFIIHSYSSGFISQKNSVRQTHLFSAQI
ncbi:hypothetical protein [Maridesulfovibrio sp.]|uniref:hypothetical protein n=1 Tax=Maridesulfovibrio sp. TaxID=2795000 RepID=UPI003BAAF206